MPKLHFCTHLQNRHNLWSFKQKKKCVLKDIFYMIYITSLFDFMLKRFHKIFANFKCVNVFCKNTEYQTSHKTKVSIVLPICTFMFKSRFFFELLNSFTLYSDCKKPIYEKLSWTRPSMRALACMWHYENALCM